MKRNKFNFLVVALIVIIFTSCSEKDSNESVGSTMLDGKTYSNNYGYLGIGTNSSGKTEYVFTFSDASSEEEIINETNTVEATFVVVPSNGDLIDGTYSYDIKHKSNLIEAFLRLHTDQSTDQWEVPSNTGSGSITIFKTNDIYDITYSFSAVKVGTSTGEKTVTGSFKGVMKLY